MSRFFINWFGIGFIYRMTDRTFQNEYFGNELWRVKDEWTVRIGLSEHFYGKGDIYYDGHTIKSATLFWIEISTAYTYDSRPAIAWEPL